jgi:hypothetical protein
MRLARARITDQAERLAVLHPGAGRELVDDGGGDGGVGGEVELIDSLVAGEPRCCQTPGDASGVAVIAFGHHEFGEKSQVGQLFTFCGGRDLSEPGTDRGQS